MSVPPSFGKVKKTDVLYILDPRAKGRYQCSQCWMWISESERCLAHGKDDVIRDVGSCGLWVYGEPARTGTPKGSVTKGESGYMENDPGFGCHRCEEFDGQSRCRKVEGRIAPAGCCAAWEQGDD